MPSNKPPHNAVWSDSTARASAQLNAVLEEDIVHAEHASKADTVQTPLVDADIARQEERVLKASSDRSRARVLFFTKDAAALSPGSSSYRRFADLRHLFAEVHVIVLSITLEAPVVLRPFETVWVYTTASASWWRQALDAYRIAENQLVFSGGLRADIIIAEDPFESGLAAWYLARQYGREYHVHLYEDFFDEAFVEAHEHPTFYAWGTYFVLKRASSVLAKTEAQRRAAVAIHEPLAERSTVLPRYYDLSGWRDLVPTFDLHSRYPQFKFIILHISSMQKLSRSYEVLMSASPLLRRYPTVGLVVVGNGPFRSQLEKQAIALGLRQQIEFEPMPAEIVSHLKSANLFIHISEDENEDDVILAAASVRVPVIGNKHGTAGKLFTEGVSARLCAPDDTRCLTESINMYLNDNRARTAFAISAQETVFERVEQDYVAYLKAYAGLIERSLTLGS